MLTRKLPLAAFLAATLVAASSHACGPFFPNYLLADRQANLLYLPEELCFRAAAWCLPTTTSTMA
jgi:hypothetical protein